MVCGEWGRHIASALRLLGLAPPHSVREWMQHEGLVVEARCHVHGRTRCRSLGGVRRSSSPIAIRIALTHSTPLPFPAQFACALFVLDIAGDGAKSVPDGQKQRQSCCKEDAQKARGATLAKVLGGVAWMELHAVLLLGLDTCAKPGFA